MIEIENLFYTLGNYTILDDINITIESGEFVSLVGPNGGGKSSLIKLILGLVEPSVGSVRVNNKLPHDLNCEFFGYVPQLKGSDRNFPALAIELVVSGLTANWVGRINQSMKNKCMEALEQVNAEHLAFRPISKLSGGELQRIYLARSIVRKPKVMLLDEPATGIDNASERDFNIILDELRRNTNTTFVMATHDWESAFHHSDKVIILNKRVVCYDSPEKAFNDDALRVAFGHEGHKHDMIFGQKKEKK